MRGMWPTGLYDLYAVIADFHDKHPGVAIHFVEGTQMQLLAQIRADELDAIFTAVDPDELGDEFAATLLSEEEFVCAMPVGHEFTDQSHVSHVPAARRPRPRHLPRELGAAFTASSRRSTTTA